MMFAEVLSRWNNGEARGAQTRLARKMGLAPNTISQWVTGVSRPDADLRPRLARELKIEESLLDTLFPGHRRAGGFRESPDPASASSATPVYGPIGSEPFRFAFDGGLPEEFLPLRLSGSRTAAIKVRGDWTPLARDGEYLLLAEGPVSDDGKWVVAEEATGCRLKPYGEAVSSGDRVLGVVVGRYSRIEIPKGGSRTTSS